MARRGAWWIRTRLSVSLYFVPSSPTFPGCSIRPFSSVLQLQVAVVSPCLLNKRKKGRSLMHSKRGSAPSWTRAFTKQRQRCGPGPRSNVTRSGVHLITLTLAGVDRTDTDVHVLGNILHDGRVSRGGTSAHRLREPGRAGNEGASVLRPKG